MCQSSLPLTGQSFPARSYSMSYGIPECRAPAREKHELHCLSLPKALCTHRGSLLSLLRKSVTGGLLLLFFLSFSPSSFSLPLFFFISVFLFSPIPCLCLAVMAAHVGRMALWLGELRVLKQIPVLLLLLLLLFLLHGY